MTKIELQAKSNGRAPVTPSDLSGAPSPRTGETRSNATSPDTTSTIVRVQSAGQRSEVAAAEAALVRAEQLASGRNVGAARALADQVRKALPTGYDPSEKALIEAAFSRKAGDDLEHVLSALVASAAAAFDASPALNRGFNTAQITAMFARVGAVEARCDVIELETRIQAAAATPLEADPPGTTDFAKSERPYQAAQEALSLVAAAERLKASPGAAALARSTYEKRRDAYIAAKISLVDAATNAGRSGGLLAVGWTRMHDALGVLRSVRTAAGGLDPAQDQAVQMPKSSDAQRAVDAFVAMLTSALEQGKTDWAAIVDKTKNAELAQAFDLVDGDLSLGRDVLDMTHRVLGRLPEMAPLSVQSAELELGIAQRALDARSQRESALGVVARRVEAACRAIVRYPQGTAPEVVERAAVLEKQADALSNAILAARGTLPPEAPHA